MRTHDHQSLSAAATSPAPIGPGAAQALGARQGGPAVLAQALGESRRDTLATFAALARALPGLAVPLNAELNPPLWELGHIGWFQEWWVLRLPPEERRRGHRANPAAARTPPRRPNADALYNSSTVPHDSRWQLPLPDADATRADLEAGLAQALEALDALPAAAQTSMPGDDDALYMHRLALLHEDMHHEAALYMAQGLGVAIDDARWQASPLGEPPPPLHWAPGTWALGRAAAAGFAFDNECGVAEVATAQTRIDAQVCRWAEYLPFVEAGGYADQRLWSEPGLAWLQARAGEAAPTAPRYLRNTGSAGRPQWQQWRHGQWRALDLREAACHLTLHEAQAWCRWAGRRLPSEAEWERAALTAPAQFAWGQVWEWTASPFAPFAGFVPHPYRDYSAPWFDGRPVLRGASFMTQPRMKHPRYRNFFPAHRNDVPAGFRSCAL